VTAVEKDNRLAPYLRERFADEPRLTLIHSDVLDCDLRRCFRGPAGKLVATCPMPSPRG
jgi:16S rRNA A1518/A1519 N6-dimethyltransferase RsmA/KsgA/DIM1 with predicted DNA glycosylase/AP lyase activity